MAPSRRKGCSHTQQVLQEEDVLTAVVIADTFTSSFYPMTLNTPIVLQPLVNVPLIEYTLRSLASTGVKEIFIFCCQHAPQIRHYIENSGWQKSGASCSVDIITSDGCISLGDALREVDAKAMIRSDFILLFGDTVVNLNFQKLMDKFRLQKGKDKSCVISMVYKKVSQTHPFLNRDDNTVLVLDSESQKVLHYGKTLYSRKVSIPSECIMQHKSVDLHYDLMNTHVCLCSPHVPQLFTDNFDYATMGDFVKGLIINEEIQGSSMYCEIIDEDYACRVSNLSMYECVSREIMERWTYPYVPDLLCKGGMSHGRHGIYMSDSVTLARGCTLEKNVVIGHSTIIGSNAYISGSVIGDNCSIGENVTIHNSFIWNGCTIDDNCYLDTCIVCDDCIVKGNVKIERGTILSYNVEVGPSVTLPSHTLLVSSPIPHIEDFGDTPQNIAVNNGKYGSRAYVYDIPVDSDAEEGEAYGDHWPLYDNIKHLDEESSDDESNSEQLSHTDSPVQDDIKVFYSEVLDTLQRAEMENIGTDNQVLEINSLKHAYNITIKDVNLLIIQAIIDMSIEKLHLSETASLYETFKSTFKFYEGVIRNYIRNKNSQIQCLLSLEEYSLRDNSLATILVKVIHFFYEVDILQEEAITSWYENVLDNEEKHDRITIRKPVAPLIKWFHEAEEESEESS